MNEMGREKSGSIVGALGQTERESGRERDSQ